MEGLKGQVKNFWTHYPCAKNVIPYEEGTYDFFQYHDRVIDVLTPYHTQVYQYESCRGKRVLEIGCGMGVYARRLAEQAKEFYAVDLALKSVELTRKRLKLYNLDANKVFLSDAENLPFKNNYFDRVISHGVIHHSPDTQQAANEIYRVLKPGGLATVMIYHKNSIFYWLDLMLIGRMKYAAFKLSPARLAGFIAKYKKSAAGLKEAVNKTNWLDLGDLVLRFSDGHFNPHTKVYTLGAARRLFHRFKDVKVELRSPANRFLEKAAFVNKRFGWGLFIYAQK